MPYNTRQEALAISFSLSDGIGAHKTKKGEWNPCKTPEAYVSVKKNKIGVFKPPIEIDKELKDLGFESQNGFSINNLIDMEAKVINKSTSNFTTSWISNMIQEINEEVFFF